MTRHQFFSACPPFVNTAYMHVSSQNRLRAPLVKRNDVTGGGRRDRLRPSRLASRVSRVARASPIPRFMFFQSGIQYKYPFSFYFTKEIIEV